ncbi:Uncharacterised protein [Fusobacterium necrophorum subsp. necrophorum]|nr:Uncharacterised protein [Fusobacterium necrophorum subsp. necrophorum]
MVGVEDNGELTGFQYIGAHSIEEFKTAPIKLLRDTPIMFEVIEVPIENCRNQKDTVLVFDIKPSTKQVIICYDREVYYESRMKLTNYLMNKEDFWNMIKGNDF